MKRSRFYLAAGLISLMAAAPLLSVADTLRYRYVISLDIPEKNTGNEGDSDGSKPDDDYLTHTTDWVGTDEEPVCQDYSPSADTVPEGVWFYQYSDNCQRTETRQIITYKMQEGSGEPIVIGEPVVETRTVTSDGSRGETGTNKNFSIYVTAPRVTSPEELYLYWESNGAVSYRIKSSSASGGVPTAYQDLGSTSELALNPSPGVYTYTVEGTNSSGETVEGYAQVEVLDFKIKSFTVQETTVSPGDDMHLSWDAPAGATLTLAGYGDVTGMSSIVVPARNLIGANTWRLSATAVVKGQEVSSRIEVPYTVVPANAQ